MGNSQHPYLKDNNFSDLPLNQKDGQKFKVNPKANAKVGENLVLGTTEGELVLCDLNKGAV